MTELTLILKTISIQVVKALIPTKLNSSQDYTSPDDQPTTLTYLGFRPFFVLRHIRNNTHIYVIKKTVLIWPKSTDKCKREIEI